MSYLYVKWNSFGLRSSGDVSDIRTWLPCAGHSRSEDLRRRRRRAEVIAEGVARDELLGKSRPSGTLANAVVCNICPQKDSRRPNRSSSGPLRRRPASVESVGIRSVTPIRLYCTPTGHIFAAGIPRRRATLHPRYQD
jgi:hypothetical protein